MNWETIHSRHQNLIYGDHKCMWGIAEKYQAKCNSVDKNVSLSHTMYVCMCEPYVPLPYDNEKYCTNK